MTINGGLGANGVQAQAVAIIGNGLVRSNLVGMKFDRVNYGYYITNLQQVDTFTAIINRVQYPLTWAPDTRIDQTVVTVNGTPVLRELYTLSKVTSMESGYTQYTGSITFTFNIAVGSTIIVTYHKDISVLTATCLLYTSDAADE